MEPCISQFVSSRSVFGFLDLKHHLRQIRGLSSRVIYKSHEALCTEYQAMDLILNYPNTSILSAVNSSSNECSNAIKLIIRWMKIFAPRCLVILKLFQNFLRRLSPDGYYEKEFHLMLFHGIRQKFHKFWPRNDPLTAITKLLYYEFEIDGYGNECRWIGHWILSRKYLKSNHRNVHVRTGVKPPNSAMKASSDEPPDVKAAQEELGYLGVPPSDASTWFTYKGGLFRVMRVSADDGGAKEIYGPKPRRLPVRELNDHQAFVVRLYATSKAPFVLWLAEAKKQFENANPLVIKINRFTGHTGPAGSWGSWSARQKRNFDDVILTKEVKNELEDLVEDFVQSGRWYSNRGLSWQKGILLHGPPGCGKTSTIVGLASKYNMKIYNLSLSNPSISDESLAAAIREVHPRSIVCFEDCDVWAKAHKRKLAKNAKVTALATAAITAAATIAATAAATAPVTAPVTAPDSGAETPGLRPESPRTHLYPGVLGKEIPATPLQPVKKANLARTKKPVPRLQPRSEFIGSRLTLSGLLNVLDGVEERRGILYILTSNDPSSLDAAIIRPGRVDAIIELDYATKQQAEDLFNSFYKPREEEQPPYDITKVASYAKTFSSGITEGEFSPASLQSFLLEHRVDPPGALVALPEWVSKQREDKAFHSLSRTIAAMVTDKSKSSVSQPPESAPESDTGSDSEVEDESD